MLYYLWFALIIYLFLIRKTDWTWFTARLIGDDPRSPEEQQADENERFK